MTDAGATSRRRKLWRYLLTVSLACLLLLGGLSWYATTDSFQSMVRRRLVAELERITGGRVELGSFHTTPFRLRVEVRDLTIHGSEKTGEVPYAHVGRVVAQVKIISLLGFEFGFHSLILDHPIIHIVVYPNGTTNQPPPTVKLASEQTPAERLFKLSIGQLEIRSGELLWNDEKIPFDFTSNDVSAEMTYSVLHRRYFGSFLLGKVVSQWKDYRPVAWMAEAHFSLGADRIDFGSLKVNSGRSHLDASGSMIGFHHPRIEGNYHARLDVEEFAAITRRSESRGGIAEAQGHGAWSENGFSATGKLLLKDVGWHDPSLNVEHVNAASQFSITPDRLTLTQFDAHMLGGIVAGNADVTGWSTPSPTVKDTRMRAQEQKGLVQLRVKEISAGAVADAISEKSLPLNRLNLAGAATGTIDVRWKGSPRRADTGLALEISTPTAASAKQLSVNGRIRATYHGENGELDVADFSVGTHASHVEAAGNLGRSGVLKLSAATSDFAEWQSVLVALGRQEKIPAILHGHASFTGTASGIIPNVTFAGSLQAQDFDYLLGEKARSQGQAIHWDSLDAWLQVSPRMFVVRNGVLQMAGTKINVSAAGELVHWQFSDQSPFNARLAVHNGELGEVLLLGGYNYPVRGTLNLYMQASGTLAQPQANGRVQLSEVKVRGETFQNFDTALRITGRQAQLNHLELIYGAARVSGAADYDFSGGTFRLDVGGTNFDLASLAAGRTGRVQLGGHLDFTLHGSGKIDEPSVNATLHLHDLTVDRERQGDFTFQALTQGQDVRLTGRSQFEPAELKVDGDVHLRDGWPSTLKLSFSHLSLNAPLRPYLGTRLTGPSAASGELLVEGPLRRARDLTLTGSLSDFTLDVENMKLQNQGPIAFAISSQTLQLKTLRLLGEETDLSADGTVELTGNQAVSLRARGQANLKLLESFDPSFISSGAVNAEMEISGTFSKPILRGRLQIANGAVAYADLPAGFSGISGSVTFDQNRMQIENLTARTGGGLVTFDGSAAWIARQLSFDVNLQEKDVRLRYPPGISSTANADLHFAGNSSASTLSGEVTVTKLSVMPGFDFGAYLARTSRSTALPVTNPMLNRIHLDVHVMTTPELQMQTAVVRLSGDADLRLRGNAAKPVLMGRAEVLEGEVSFNGTKYELERGEVTFQNPVTTTPELDLQATTHVRDYDITLGLNGEPDKLRVSYRSEPPLPEADIITLLALGRTTTESAQLQESGQSSFTQEASSAIISQALNATVTNRAQRLFGVSRIKIDPEGLTSETTLGRGPAVTIEQQVADNLTLTYSTSVEYASQQIIQVVYDLPHNISIVAIRDQNGVVSFDVKVRRRKK